MDPDPFADVVDRIDIWERPVGEIASLSYRGLATQLEACPYAGSRHGQPMNVTALRLLRSVWPAVLELYRQHAGEARVCDAWRLCAALTVLPGLLPEPIPGPAAAAFRTSQGLSQAFALLALAETGASERLLSSFGGPDDFHAWLDSSGWLVGREQVCAAPPAMITDAFQALAVPGPVLSPSVDALLTAAASRLALEAAEQLRRVAAVRAGLEPTAQTSSRHAFVNMLLCDPQRPPEHVLALYPRGEAPVAVTGLLEAQLDDRFAWQRALDQLAWPDGLDRALAQLYGLPAAGGPEIKSGS